jgi:uncharacterized membrane protein YozB (DUF420 family)
MIVFPGLEPSESKLVYTYPHDRIDSKYRYPTAYKPLYYFVLYQEIYLETRKIILVLYRIIILSPALY